MKARIFILCLVTAMCALPIVAQNIPAGDDLWSSVGGGSSYTTLTDADWFALCGVHPGNVTVNLKGQALSGMGNGDTIVTRLDAASLPTVPSSATVRIQLKSLSMVSDGSHPCSPYTLTVGPSGTQSIDYMTITRSSSGGGTFVAVVPVKVVITAYNGGTVVGSTVVSGNLGDTTTTTPWSYSPPTGGAIQSSPWYPAVDPSTGQNVTGCRFGNESAPSEHCYKQASCPGGAAAKSAVRGKSLTVAKNLCAVVAQHPIEQ
ncbi:MAG TPA: hypothetical protein VLX28_24200 [Thermoanaerobaculia bacterium]|nr:hypothetical protein [Thermoanaerobaculia bacterium]